jgi:hypothetical protein
VLARLARTEVFAIRAGGLGPRPDAADVAGPSALNLGACASIIF